MTLTKELTGSDRLMVAGLTGLSGGATAAAIMIFGGSMRRHLPDTGFHLAAVVGACLAGFILADGLGRSGVKGVIYAVLTAVCVTLLGAWLGAMLLTPFGNGGVAAGFLGWIALTDAATAHPLIFKIWLFAMVALNLSVSAIRADPGDVSP